MSPFRVESIPDPAPDRGGSGWFLSRVVSANERELGFGRGRVDADFSSVFAAFELHNAGHSREQCMIPSEIDIKPGEKLGATLTDDDAAGLDGFSAVRLHAQILWATVPSVP